jgi:colicin import membrane protein
LREGRETGFGSGFDVTFLKRSHSNPLLRTTGFSLIIHVAIIVLFSLNPLPTIVRFQPAAYTVTLMSVSLPEPEVQKTPLPPPPPPKAKETLRPVEKSKPIERVRKEDIVEKVKKAPKKVEKTEEKKVDLKKLQEALQEIHKKVALDEIKKKLARNENRKKVEEQPAVIPPRVPVISSTKTQPGTDERMNKYYSLVWAKIKEAWTIPENLYKETIDLEATIVVIIDRDGGIQKWWFEKKSGHAFYDQSVVRAIMKAEPLPPIPGDIPEKSLEIGLRFKPD